MMLKFFLLCSVVCSCLAFVTVDDVGVRKEALKKNENNLESVGDAVEKMQNYATMDQIKLSKCGLPNVSITGAKTKKYDAKAKWDRTTLDYNIQSYPSIRKYLSPSDVDRIIAQAFYDLWSEAAPVLKFVKTNNLNATIKINFYAYDHPGDSIRFDGPNGVLAHGFYPPDGRLHFDDSETWNTNSFSGKSLLPAAVHGLGHILGLGHSNVPTSVMHPDYNGDLVVKLDQDDVAGIKSLYPSS